MDGGDLEFAVQPQPPTSPMGGNPTQGSLMNLPHELVEEILVLCDPVEAAKVAMTCHRMYGIVYGEEPFQLLRGSRSQDEGVDREKKARTRGRKAFWRALYLAQPLDDLRTCVNWLGEPRVSCDREFGEGMEGGGGGDEDGGIDWQEELKKVIRARMVAGNAKSCRGEEELREVLRTFLGLVHWTPPVSGRVGEDEGSELAKNLVWVPVVLKEFLDVIGEGVHDREFDGSENLELWRVPPRSMWRKETRQLCAQLHILYGLTRRDLARSTRVESRAYVYDMRRYTAENEYGPLTSAGGSVDWEHLQRIHHMVSMHIVWASVKELVESRIFENEGGEDAFEYMIYPMSMPFTQTVVPKKDGMRRIPPVEAPGDETEGVPKDGDWAGIEGKWSVCFCFTDHRELIAYNESANACGDLNTSLFEAEDFVEVFRRLEVTLHVTKVANDPEHPGRPIIGFVGAMEPPSTSTMYGLVQLTGDNHVKWQFYSGEMGAAPAAIWSSVGIQVGGIGSQFGVLGSWTTVFHDAEDPVGPFWMQKRESKQTHVNT